VSRRLALGYRNHNDLGHSLKLTVRKPSDIEHGVRKASPDICAMLENPFAWRHSCHWREGSSILPSV
jgi:hypothetical protein